MEATAMKAPAEAVKQRALAVINEYFADCKKLLAHRRSVEYRIYEAATTFEEKKQADWQTSFKVNKAFTILEKNVAKVVSNRPKWKIKARNSNVTEKEVAAIQDVLDVIFHKRRFWKRLKLWYKKGGQLGLAHAKPGYCMELGYSDPKGAQAKAEPTSDSGEQAETPAAGEAEAIEPIQKVEPIDEAKYKEDVVDEHPTIELMSFTDVYYDPRRMFIEDMPAFIHDIPAQRWSSILKNKRKYFDVEKIKEETSSSKGKTNDTRAAVIAILIPSAGTDLKIDNGDITLRKYYGYFSETEAADESLYELTAIAKGDTAVKLIGMRPIKKIPVVALKAFEDTETYFATGVIEPMLGLQDEINFGKNSAAHYVNSALNRQWFWDPNSGINPADLNSAPGNIIPVAPGYGEKAQNLLREVAMRDLPPGYWNQQADLERQVQQMAFSVDTSQPASEQALNNTATGAKISFMDSNTVINALRDNFEDAMVEMAYMLIEELFDNVGDHWAIKRVGEDRYFSIHRSVFQDAYSKFDIQVDVGSMALDSEDTQKREGMEWWEYLVAAKKEGVPVDLEKAFEDIARDFGRDDGKKYLLPKNPKAAVSELLSGGALPTGADQPVNPAVPNPASPEATLAALSKPLTV